MGALDRIFVTILTCFFFGTIQCQSDPWAEVPIILSRIQEPVIPDRVCNIRDYGAIQSPSPDAVTAPYETVQQNTAAFTNAVGICSSAGGGTVLVPAGTFITSAIYLKSNISLKVEGIIRFTRNTTDYPIVFTRWEGIELMNYSPFIYAFEEENLKITGSGTIDGNCDCENWWPWKGTWYDQCWETTAINQTNARNRLFQMAEDDIPVAQRVFGEGHYLRPQFIQPYRSKNILIEGVTLTNSPMWIVHPVLCDNVIVRNINISSLGPNSDGVDPESCHDVWIHGVIFNNGDDDIAIKSGRNADGRRVNRTSENIVIQNCSMAEGHGGITLGSCISGGVRNVFAENCYLDSPKLDTAIRVKNNALRGGLLERFFLRNIRVGKVGKQVIEVDFFYEEGPNADFRPVMKDFVIENPVVTGSAPYSIFARGYDNHPSSSYIGLELRNAIFEGLTNNPHFVLDNIDDIKTLNVTVNGVLWSVPDQSSHASNQMVSGLGNLGYLLIAATILW